MSEPRESAEIGLDEFSLLVLTLFGFQGDGMKRAIAVCGFMALLAVASPGRAITLEDVPAPVVMPQLPTGAKPQPVTLARMITSIEVGHPWATFQKTRWPHLDCVTPDEQSLTWKKSSFELDKRTVNSIMAQELKAAGFSDADDPENLFQSKNADADLEIGGNIKDIQANICLYYRDSVTVHSRSKGVYEKYNYDTITGGIIFIIDWQIYSKSKGELVADQTIKSGYILSKHESGNSSKLILGGVRENVRALIASDGFRKAVLEDSPTRATRTGTRSRIPLTGAAQGKPVKISDAVGSVVLVLSGGGHGSGFLVSSDGYLMTAQHVVGTDKYVKIRWSDGLEGVGEVVRTNKRRDVALIKVDPRGRHPLPLHREAPEPGNTVFAIGAPLDEKLQSTVTRGVASANRIMDGFSFIQSDVTINPGNSGGPLLDEKGAVLGIADLTLRDRGDTPTGLNFFVPIRDGLDFLSLDLR